LTEDKAAASNKSSGWRDKTIGEYRVSNQGGILVLQYDYVIVGAGMAADAAISGIRRRDPQGSVLVIGEEPFPPYQRPPLSKKLWLDMRLEEAF
jgi:NAD(P)H-nitrite reductase